MTWPTTRFRDVEFLWPPNTVVDVLAVLIAVRVGIGLGARSGQAAVGLVRRAIRFVRRRRTREPVSQSPDWPADWPLTLSLLVRADEREGMLHPSVQVRGPADGRSGRIRLELVDPHGEVRLTVERSFPAEALNAELPLPSFAAPAGATVEEVLRWRWDVVLSGATGELRWRERPAPAGGLNPEAELVGGRAA
jgi:hypothetical protein